MDELRRAVLALAEEAQSIETQMVRCERSTIEAAVT
jgi:hypothetical protein